MAHAVAGPPQPRVRDARAPDVLRVRGTRQRQEPAPQYSPADGQSGARRTELDPVRTLQHPGEGGGRRRPGRDDGPDAARAARGSFSAENAPRDRRGGTVRVDGGEGRTEDQTDRRRWMHTARGDA